MSLRSRFIARAATTASRGSTTPPIFHAVASRNSNRIPPTAFRSASSMKRDAHEVGTAYEAGDFSKDAIRCGARAGALPRPSSIRISRDFPSSRESSLRRSSRRAISRAHPMRTSSMRHGRHCAAPSAHLYEGRSRQRPHPALVLGGDVSIYRDRIALDEFQLQRYPSDESAHFSSSVTALIESPDAKGTASAVGRSVADMDASRHVSGARRPGHALALHHGVRPEAKTYRVVFGPQPVAEIINYMILGSLTTGAFHAASSAYHGKFGAEVMDKRLSLFDDPVMRSAPSFARLRVKEFPPNASISFARASWLD